MALVDSSGFAHVRLTVTDIARSKKFYDDVFGWPTAVDATDQAGEDGVTDDPERFFGGVIYQTPQGTLFGLRPGGSGAFDSSATGLDHVSFAVESREALDRVASALSDADVEHGEVKDLTGAGLAILSFQDPDDINIELTAPLASPEETQEHPTVTDTNDVPEGENGLFVRDSGGEGRPVLLIHGWPLSGDAWSAQVPALQEAGYRTVVYDRRGFGQSDPGDGYDYDALSDDVDNILSDLDLREVTLIGFSMGGGEVARYASRHGLDRIHSVVFAAAVPPYLLTSDDNPDGPLGQEAAEGMEAGLKADRDAFFDDFMTQFFTAGDELKVTEEQRQEAVALCRKSDQQAALGCMEAFGTTDFRADLSAVSVPTLVIHGDSDGIVPFEGSGKRTHDAIEGSELVVVEGAPHGLNVSHAEEFNAALLAFLAK
ncbi:Putative arylesterase (modular protein) [metagenome]|uniref:Arylesterase (Modular protein) n=1 Tax=metagenome TaxID=256318 RepID=A0A2P2C5K2_9ZZZZ